LPATAVEAAASVNLLLPVPGEGMPVGAKVAVTPFGSPLTLNATADLNPFKAAVVSVTAADLLAATVGVVLLGVSVKVGASTVNARRRIRVSPAPLPLIVSVE